MAIHNYVRRVLQRMFDSENQPTVDDCSVIRKSIIVAGQTRTNPARVAGGDARLSERPRTVSLKGFRNTPIELLKCETLV